MNLKDIRKSKKETQKDLADFLGVSLRTVQNYESGKVTIPNAMIKKIAQHYEVSVTEIFADKENMLVDLKNMDRNQIAVFIVENWEYMMEDNLFSANFKAKAGEWALQIKKSM
ncbi:helix-turn-helix transcriptional regulator [uncultured Tenacibaculum sp.]|uniref:helix-turn-helix domain-containing protein n=1 Tax=uncultured Tenacibaculum sp. TaxID=174713 RepID=UPI0026111864|nr:helix-turn-helix transcriptional regulator [uncultured Tenacibaculum sp.]